jgi:integrase
MRQLTRQLNERGTISRRPKVIDRYAKKERLARKVKKADDTYSRTEYVRIMRAAEPIDRIKVSLGYRLAFRISDVCSLEWSRVSLDPDDPVIKFRGDDKATKFVQVPLPGCVFWRLRRLKDEAGGSRWVFPQERNQTQPIKTQQFDFKALRERAKVTRGTFKTFRHTRLSLDFGNPKLSQAHVMIMRRVSYQVALEHYIHPNSDDRRQMRAGSR